MLNKTAGILILDMQSNQNTKTFDAELEFSLRIELFAISANLFKLRVSNPVFLSAKPKNKNKNKKKNANQNNNRHSKSRPG